MAINLKNAIAASTKYFADNANGEASYNVVGTVGEILNGKELKGAEVFVNKNKTGLYFRREGAIILSLNFTKPLRKMLETKSLSHYELINLGVQQITQDSDGAELDKEDYYYLISAPQGTAAISVSKLLEMAAEQGETAPTKSQLDSLFNM